jgi:hypothetical protein
VPWLSSADCLPDLQEGEVRRFEADQPRRRGHGKLTLSASGAGGQFADRTASLTGSRRPARWGDARLADLERSQRRPEANVTAAMLRAPRTRASSAVTVWSSSGSMFIGAPHLKSSFLADSDASRRTVAGDDQRDHE